MKQIKLILIFLGLLVLNGCRSERALEIHLQGHTMGTTYSIKVEESELRPEFENLGKEQLRKEIDALLSQVNAVFSTYDSNSEVSLFNKLSAGERFYPSKEFVRLLRSSLDLYTKTDYYFDITLGPLINAWGFGPKKVLKAPSPKELENLKKYVGWDKLKLMDEDNSEMSALSKSHEKVYLDFSAIAKGHGVDKAAELLLSKGMRNFMVEIGGEVRAHGKKRSGRPWLLGIENPSQGPLLAVVKLSDMAMATSGDYRNFKRVNGESFSHVFDPRAGMPKKSQLVSVTVLHALCSQADAYATAMLAMGPQKALEIAKKESIPVYLVVKKDEEFAIIATENFKSYLQSELQSKKSR